MKRILLFLVAIVLGLNLAIAQTTPAKSSEKKAEKKEIAKTKKDGTPDMRYKENKEAAKKEAAPAGPLKKDGTPDMRHKANKEAAKKAETKK